MLSGVRVPEGVGLDAVWLLRGDKLTYAFGPGYAGRDADGVVPGGKFSPDEFRPGLARAIAAKSMLVFAEVREVRCSFGSG